MTTAHEPDHVFDRHMRQLHATALDQVSPQVRSRLRSARHGASTGPADSRRWRGWPWLAASLGSAVLAIAIGVQWLPVSDRAPEEGAMLAAVSLSAEQDAYADSLAALDESPEFFLWLASTEVQPFAME